MSAASKTKTANFLFLASVWWRIFYGFLRIFFGLALLKMIGEPLIKITTRIMNHELLSKSPDIIFTFISNLLTEYNFSVTYFLAFYFLFWGTIDIILFYNLFKKNLWAFPISLLLISLFILYSLFRLTYTHSLVLLAVIIMDIIIMFLIYREYQMVKSAVRTDPSPTHHDHFHLEN